MDINYKVMERCEYTDAAQPASGSAFISLFLFLLLCAAPLISSRANTPTETYTAGLEKIRRKNRCDTNGRKSRWFGIRFTYERSHRPRFFILCLVSSIGVETKNRSYRRKAYRKYIIGETRGEIRDRMIVIRLPKRPLVVEDQGNEVIRFIGRQTRFPDTSFLQSVTTRLVASSRFFTSDISARCVHSDRRASGRKSSFLAGRNLKRKNRTIRFRICRYGHNKDT